MIRPKKTKGQTLSAIRVHLKDTELPYATLIADPEPYVGYVKAEDGFTLYSPLRTETLVCESLFADVSNRKRITILDTRTFETVVEYMFDTPAEDDWWRLLHCECFLLVFIGDVHDFASARTDREGFLRLDQKPTYTTRMRLAVHAWGDQIGTAAPSED